VPSDDVDIDRLDPPVVIEFQLSAQEMAAALRSQLLRRPVIWVLPVWGVLLAVIGVIFLVSPGVGAKNIVGFALLGIGVYTVAVFAYVVWRAPLKAWHRNEGLRGPQMIAFSEEGYQARSTFSEGRSTWALMKASFENDRFYMLLLSTRRAYLVIPKRAFKSKQDEERFRHLIERHTESHLKPANHM
jgi:hypothetical protein